MTAAEFFRGLEGRAPENIGELIDHGLVELARGATLDSKRAVLTVTSSGTTYTFSYDDAAGTVVATVVAPADSVGPGCP